MSPSPVDEATKDGAEGRCEPKKSCWERESEAFDVVTRAAGGQLDPLYKPTSYSMTVRLTGKDNVETALDDALILFTLIDGGGGERSGL